LVPELLRVLGVFFDLVTQAFDLFLVVIQALAEVLLHVFDLRILREQVQKVLHFEHVPLVDDLKCLLHVDFFLRLESRRKPVQLVVRRLRVLVVEEILGDLHPQLLLDFEFGWLVCILLGQVDVLAFQCELDGFGVEVKYAVELDLGFLHRLDLGLDLRGTVAHLLNFQQFLKLLTLASAHIQSVVDFE